MALPAFTPPIPPSPGTGRKPTIKILEADFGDGYSQPIPDGLNHIRQSVALTWNVLSETQMQTIEAFLVARKGTEAFLYQPAGDPAAKAWTCRDWSAELDEGAWKMSATLVQSFTRET